jgi:hypothetical protein
MANASRKRERRLGATLITMASFQSAMLDCFSIAHEKVFAPIIDISEKSMFLRVLILTVHLLSGKEGGCRYSQDPGTDSTAVCDGGHRVIEEKNVNE